MGQLKHSEEEILKLGEKLIVELELVSTVNTLARWLAHYLAELIYEIKVCESKTERNRLKKECCSLILEIWEKKERVPIEKPLTNLKPIIEVLGLLTKNEHHFIDYGFFNLRTKFKSKYSSWFSFLKSVKSNSERIYSKSLLSMISDEALKDSKEWIDKHSSFLSKEEKSIIERLDSIKEVTFSSEPASKEIPSEKEKIENLFCELEELIDEQKLALLNLKKEMISNLS